MTECHDTLTRSDPHPGATDADRLRGSKHEEAIIEMIDRAHPLRFYPVRLSKFFREISGAVPDVPGQRLFDFMEAECND